MKMKMQLSHLCRVYRRRSITTNGGVGGRKSDSEIPNLYSKITAKTPRLLTQKELTTINLLIPRLCLSDHTHTAAHLAVASLPLLPNPIEPTKALSFSILAHSLTSSRVPDMAPPMSLLTALSHSEPSRPHLPRVGSLLVTSYLRKARPLEAFKVHRWLSRRGLHPAGGYYGILVRGLLEAGMVGEAMRVLREMVVEAGIAPGRGVRRRVYMALLKEAVVPGAIELDRALLQLEVEGDIDDEDEQLGSKKVGNLLDQVLAQLD